jgi:hypothetical protein
MTEKTVPIQLVESFYADTYQDYTYGSQIEFIKGKPVNVPAAIAEKLLRHADVYEKAKSAKEDAIIPEKPKPFEDTTEIRDVIERMTAAELIQFAEEKYKTKLNRNLGTDNIRAECIRLVDLMGIV